MSRYAPWGRWRMQECYVASILLVHACIAPSTLDIKASPARKVERFVFEREFSHPSLDALMHLSIRDRASSCVLSLWPNLSFDLF